jgi:predicted nucleotidyltransferase
MPTDIIPADIRRGIEQRLEEVERRNGVAVFYACESGSRAWDFASEDSDFDVRFLYVRPAAAYLSLWEQRDVIETPIEGVYDVNGWDLAKALRLGAKSNPVLFEWLASPIRYRDSALAGRFRDAVSEFYDPGRAYHHYLSMARGQSRAFLSASTVRHKKYLYVLRPLLACELLLRKQEMIPMRFADLVASVDVPPPVLDAIASLLAAKRSADEAARGERIPVLDRWIDEGIARFEAVAPPAGATPDPRRLDDFFVSALGVT